MPTFRLAQSALSVSLFQYVWKKAKTKQLFSEEIKRNIDKKDVRKKKRLNIKWKWKRLPVERGKRKTEGVVWYISRKPGKMAARIGIVWIEAGKEQSHLWLMTGLFATIRVIGGGAEWKKADAGWGSLWSCLQGHRRNIQN